MADPAPPELSVVVPAHDEEDNVEPLVAEIDAAIGPTGLSYEIVVVDDCSSDQTLPRLRRIARENPRLRVLRMQGDPDRPGRGMGQSAAFHAAIRAARGGLIAMLDADLQNDPADIPPMLQVLREEGADVVQGDRRAGRRDGPVRRASSAVGRLTRRMLLGDTIADTGCSLRVLRREAALRLPLEFRGMHRFIPVTCRHLGYRVVERPVSHRRRASGQSKYGIGNRAIPGLIDCFAVRWMRTRRRPVESSVVGIAEKESP